GRYPGCSPRRRLRSATQYPPKIARCMPDETLRRPSSSLAPRRPSSTPALGPAPKAASSTPPPASAPELPQPAADALRPPGGGLPLDADSSPPAPAPIRDGAARSAPRLAPDSAPMSIDDETNPTRRWRAPAPRPAPHDSASLIPATS